MKEADEKEEFAKSTGNLTLLTKSNALRRHAKEKSEALTNVEKQIALKMKELQHLR